MLTCWRKGLVLVRDEPDSGARVIALVELVAEAEPDVAAAGGSASARHTYVELEVRGKCGVKGLWWLLQPERQRRCD